MPEFSAKSAFTKSQSVAGTFFGMFITPSGEAQASINHDYAPKTMTTM